MGFLLFLESLGRFPGSDLCFYDLHALADPRPAGSQRFRVYRPRPVATRKALVGEGSCPALPRSGQGAFLGGEVLVVGGYAGVPEKESGRGS